MGTEITTSVINDAAAWDAFVQSSGNGSVFSTSPWLEAVAPLQGGRVVRIGALRGDEIVAGVSFIEIARGGLRKAVSPILTPYAGLLYGPQEREESEDTSSVLLLGAEQLIQHLQSRYHQVMLAHDPSVNDIRPFSWQGWSIGVRYTYRLDIGDPDTVWKGFHHRTRKQVSRASKSLKAGGPVSPEVIGEMHEQTFRLKGGQPPVPGREVTAFLKRLAGNHILDIRSAVDEEGTIAGMQVNVLGADTVYALLCGTNPVHQHTGVDSFFVWEAVKQYSRTYQYLDLVGANIPSIAFFKRGFGADLKPYYVTERYSSPLVKLAFTTYATTRKLFRR